MKLSWDEIINEAMKNTMLEINKLMNEGKLKPVPVDLNKLEPGIVDTNKLNIE